MMSVLRKHSGFSLVELMVAMLIALIVMAGVISSFVSSKNTNRINDELAFIQESARFALDYMSRDIRQAGDFGCSATTGSGGTNKLSSNNLINVVNPGANSVLYSRIGIGGFDHSQNPGAFPTLITGGAGVVANTDALAVRRASTDDPADQFIVTAHNSAAGQFTLNRSQNLGAGTLMVVSDADCKHQAVFQMTGPPGISTSLQHSAGAGAPGNCTTTLRGTRMTGPAAYVAGNCSQAAAAWQDPLAGGVDLNFKPGAIVMPLRGVVYFIRPSIQDPTINSLWISYLTQGTAIPQTEELVAGIMDMRVTYGVDTDATPDGLPNMYVTANQIVADEPTPPAPAASYLVWNRVSTVRLQLLVRSRQRVLPANEIHALPGFTANGTSDSFLYQAVSTTVAVRNAFKN